MSHIQSERFQILLKNITIYKYQLIDLIYCLCIFRHLLKFTLTHVRYQKSKDQDAYLRRHETELLLHDGAENMLKRFGIDLKNLDVEKLRSDYNALYSKKETLQNTYKSAEKEINALNRKLDNLKQ